MRILVVTNMYPTERMPHAGPFVAAQVESLRRLGVHVDVLHLERASSGRRVYRGLRGRLRRFVGEVQPDVVHVAYGGVMAEAVTRAVRDRPVLITFHGSDLIGGYADSMLGAVAPRLGVTASRLAARRAHGIIVVSRSLLGALPRRVDRSRVWVVPNGVDLDRFQPLDKAECRRGLGWDATANHVLFPSTPSRPEKRYGLARAAVDGVRPSRRVDLHVLDGVPHDDIPVWLNAADVVLLTSTHEGSPVVVKEALACGVPIVSVDVGDVRERIDAVEGCYIAGATPDDLAGKLEQALARPGRIDAREHVAELSLDRVAARVHDVYRELARAPSTANAA